MLMLPPPGFDTTALNQQSNQLLGKPGMPGVGKPSPAMKSPAQTPGLSSNPLSSANASPMVQYIMKLLGNKGS